MKKRNFIKQLSIIFTIVFCLIFTAKHFMEFAHAAKIANNDSAVNSKETKEYFKKGVYVVYDTEDNNPSKDYFYIFYDEKSGHTEDGRMGIGLPFECEQMNGVIKFFFGGPDSESMDFLKIDSIKNGNIKGHFKDGKKLTFEPLENVNPDNFDSEKYLKEHKKNSM